MHPIKVVIADDHLLFVEGLKNLLNSSSEFEFDIADICDNGEEVSRTVRKHRPDILFLDLNMPGKDGLDVLLEVKKNKVNRDMRIITLTMYDDTKLVKSAFKQGVDGYILKTAAPKELIEAVGAVMNNETYFGEGVYIHDPSGGRPGSSTAGLTNGEAFKDRFNKKYNLTKRELEVLKLVGKAKNNKEIAETLYISDQTVSVHRKNLMRKLGVTSTAGLIKIAYENALV